MTTLSSHVLDADLGTPAAEVEISLHGASGQALGAATTDADGRVRFDVALAPGPHRLVFATGDYFIRTGRATFYPEVAVTFAVDPGADHVHVPLLLSPFSYTTYRGS